MVRLPIRGRQHQFFQELFQLPTMIALQADGQMVE